MFCKNCGSEVDNEVVFCPNCGKLTSNEKDDKPLGMKWIKFIVYVQMIFAFFLNLFSAYRLYSGLIYFDGTRNLSFQVYSLFPSLRYVNLVFAAFSVGIAVFSIFVRQRLVKYRTKAVDLYLIFLGLNLFISLLYYGVTYIASGINTFDTTLLYNITQSLALIFININYFRKRKHLFVN